jgi:hypothetical protein
VIRKYPILLETAVRHLQFPFFPMAKTVIVKKRTKPFKCVNSNALLKAQ